MRYDKAKFVTRGPDGDESESVREALQDHIIRVDHIAVAVPNLADSVRWYESHLGFRLIEERTTAGESTSMCSAVMSCGSIIVVLVQGNEPDCQVSKFVTRFGPGVQHVALEVKNLTEALDRLRAMGGVVDTPIIEGEGIRQAFLARDAASGMRIELIERRGGTFSDETVDQLFRAFEQQGIV